MAVEIEHKHLVVNDSYKAMSIARRHITQGYITRDKRHVVRVRISDDSAFITIKGENTGDTRAEFEYHIPLQDARLLLNMCEPPVIVKTRYIVPYGGKTWEVDEFHGHLEGLVIAEIELNEAGEPYELPPFAGDDVTSDPQYYNSNLR